VQDVGLDLRFEAIAHQGGPAGPGELMCFQDPRSTGSGTKDEFENIMLTVDDIEAISVFSSLAPAELERLARTSADIQLNPGEFAVHEGGERALFAVFTEPRAVKSVPLTDSISIVSAPVIQPARRHYSSLTMPAR
jgi:hypothetical protein